MQWPPRIVVAGEVWRGATAPALAEGFRRAGWLVEIVDLGSFMPRLGRVAGRLLRKLATAHYNKAIEATCTAFGAHALLVVKGNYISSRMLARLRGREVRTCLFYPDVEFDHPGIEPGLHREFDFVFTTKSYHQGFLSRELGEDRFALIHHGFDPMVHRNPLPLGAKPERDLVFIGNFSEYKRNFLSPLADAGVEDFAIMGHRWERAQGTPLARFVVPMAPVGDLYALELARSKIAIGLHHGPVRTPGWEDLVSTRTFEIPACGPLMLHIDNDEIRSAFDADNEAVLFRDSGELAEKVCYFLDHSGESRAIAAAGTKRAQQEHSYWHRAQDMAEILEQRLL
ncbi:MAG: glycosyltransferase [Sphingomonadaceae bacterium]